MMRMKGGWFVFETEFDKEQYLVEPSLRTDNDSVASYFEWIGWSGGAYNSNTGKYTNFLSVKPWKPGTAKMSFEDKQGKTYTVVLKALPYENPIKSLKITNINKGKNLAKKVNESFQYTSQKGEQGGLIFPKKTASPKIKLEAKTGWKIKKITAKYSGHEEYVNNVNAQTKTMKLKEADKGAELWLHITFKNTDNGAAICIVFGDLWYEE